LHLISSISTRFGNIIPEKVELPSLDLQIAKQLTPLLSIGVLALVFNTLCLKNVDASFFQIARGLLLPFTIAVSAIHTRNMPGAPTLWAAFIVFVGFFVGLHPSSYLNSTSGFTTPPSALLYGCLSALLTAIHAVLVQPAHQIVGDNSVIKLAYWGNLITALALVPCILFNGEFHLFLKSDRDWTVFIAGSIVTGIFGFLLCVAGLLSIKVTSPVTHMFSSAARSVIQTVLGVLVFGDIITSYRGGSIFVITAGTLYYTWIKSSRPRPPPSQPVMEPDLEKQLKV
jgi:GDP-fucose transporter C1